MRAKSLQLCLTLCDPSDWSVPGSSLWDFPGKNTGVGCHALLREIFPTQGQNLYLLHWRVIKNPPVKQEMWVLSQDHKDSVEEEMLTHSSILAWEISWTEEPSELQSMGLQRVRRD